HLPQERRCLQILDVAAEREVVAGAALETDARHAGLTERLVQVDHPYIRRQRAAHLVEDVRPHAAAGIALPNDPELPADPVLLRQQRVALGTLYGEARGVAHGRFMRRAELLELRVHAEVQPGDDRDAEYPASGQ